MAANLRRSIDCPLRKGLSWEELWRGSDRGLIWCWERGRQNRILMPSLALRASKGELVTLAWKRGTLQYLATWQGLCGNDLDIALDGIRQITCAKTGKSVAFKAGLPPEDEDQQESDSCPADH